MKEKREEAEKYIKETDLDNKEIAQKVGITVERVREYRRLLYLKIGKITKTYPSDVKQILGKVTDVEASKYYGRDKSVIQKWRNELGIPCLPRQTKEIVVSPDCKWEIIGSPFRDSEKGYLYVPCKCICGKITNVMVSTIRNGKTKQCKACAAKKLDKYESRDNKIIELLKTNKFSDTQIAKKLKCSRKKVREFRIKLGISPKYPTSIEIPPEIQERLGKELDTELAEKLKVSPVTVRRWRLKYNIPKFYDTREIVLPPECMWKIMGPTFSRRGNRYVPVECGCGFKSNLLVTSLRAGRTNACMSCANKNKRKK